MSTKTLFYKADSSLLTLQGIAPTTVPKNYLITGTLTNGQGALIIGEIDSITDPKNIYTVNFPNSVTTSVYGPQQICNDEVSLVGSYQTLNPGLKNPCNAFIFEGKLDELNKEDNYLEIIPPLSKLPFNTAHSNSNELAVYISSTLSGLNADLGISFIYDIKTKETISQVIYPDSLFTTTYGIWYNGKDCHYDSYTIAGGFTKDAKLSGTKIYVVDFLYNRECNEKLFVNWSEIETQYASYQHAQGITGIDGCNYRLPIVAFDIDSNGDRVFPIGGVCIDVKRVEDQFILVSSQIYKFPFSIATIPTSAADNTITGIAIELNKSTLTFTAETVDECD